MGCGLTHTRESVAPATITNDLNPERPTDYHLQAIDFLKKFKDKSVDGVLYDPHIRKDR